MAPKERLQPTILELIPDRTRRQTMCFSATVDGDIRRHAERHMKDPQMVSLSSDAVGAAFVTGSISAVHFLADSTVLVRLGGGRLVLLDRQFTVLGETTEPASVRDWGLLKYLPAGT